jgi:hypothetical protein
LPLGAAVADVGGLLKTVLWELIASDSKGRREGDKGGDGKKGEVATDDIKYVLMA